jgi:hypothetical protein
MQKFAFKWKQFLIPAKNLRELGGESTAPKTYGGAAENPSVHAVEYRR